jgi:hypothetical protein
MTLANATEPRRPPGYRRTGRLLRGPKIGYESRPANQTPRERVPGIARNPSQDDSGIYDNRAVVGAGLEILERL